LHTTTRVSHIRYASTAALAALAVVASAGAAAAWPDEEGRWTEADGQLTVISEVIPAEGGPAAPADGFVYDLTSPLGDEENGLWNDVALLRSEGSGIVQVGTLSGTTNDLGAVSFWFGYTNDGFGQVTVVQRQRDGYTLTSQNGANAVCSAENVYDGLVELDVASTDQGFTVTIGYWDRNVTCTVTSTASPTSQTVAPSATATASTPTLPNTGAKTGTILALVGALVALGGVALVVARRRSHAG